MEFPTTMTIEEAIKSAYSGLDRLNRDLISAKERGNFEEILKFEKAISDLWIVVKQLEEDQRKARDEQNPQHIFNETIPGEEVVE